MKPEIKQKYKSKAKDSFKTKKNLFVFSLAINNKEKFSEYEFKNFEITTDLVEMYTARYWQQELSFTGINNIPISEITKRIDRILAENKEALIKIEKAYVDSFNDIFPIEKFDELVSERQCHYCKITLDDIELLGSEFKLYKKNLRGWTLELDRINSNLEYTPNNCVMACYWCNNAKTDEFTEEEFIQIAPKMREMLLARLI